MDAADRAADREEEMRSDAIAESTRAASGLPYTGLCHNCVAPVGPGLRFCNKECRDDYDTRRRSEARRGR